MSSPISPMIPAATADNDKSAAITAITPSESSALLSPTPVQATRKRTHPDSDDDDVSTGQPGDLETKPAAPAHGVHWGATLATADAAYIEAYSENVADITAFADAATWAAVNAMEPDFVSRLSHFVVRAQGTESAEPKYKVDPFRPASFPRASGFFAHLAVLERDLPVLQMLVRVQPALPASAPTESRGLRKLRVDNVLECAIARGRIEMLQWLVQTLPVQAQWTWETALLETALLRCSDASAAATNSSDASAGQQQHHACSLLDVALLEWLFTNCPRASVVLSARNVAAAMRAAPLPVVQWLHCHDAVCAFSNEAINTAAASGRLDVVVFLHTHRRDGCTVDALDSAAANGHVAVVQFLHEHRTEGCTTRAMDRAAANGHLDVVRYLHEQRTEGCTADALDGAAASGHLAIVQFLHANRTEGCTTKAMDAAADRGHLDVLEFLQTHRSEGFSVDRVVRWSAKTTSLALIQFLHAHLPAAGWSEAAMDAAAAAGRLDTVTFLHEQRTEGCTTRAMDQAAEFGHLDVVQFLHEHRTEGCSVVALAQAMKNHHDDVVKFLYVHRYKDNVPNSL